jgi:glycosyltransferase involved in cell wall biosynthesis
VVVVGWFGRAEPQKSPGLALRLVAALKQRPPFGASARTCLLVAGGGTLVGGDNATTGSPLAQLAVALGLAVGRCPPFAADAAHRYAFAADNYPLSSSSSGPGGSGGEDWADVEFTGGLPHAALLAALERRVDVLVHTNVLEETFCMVLGVPQDSPRPIFLLVSAAFFSIVSLNCIHFPRSF